MVKKENEQFEDLTSTGAGNSKQVHDKIVRTLKTTKIVMITILYVTTIVLNDKTGRNMLLHHGHLHGRWS